MTEPIVVTQHIAAPPEVVYSYLTESAKWARWQGRDAEIEAHPGGIFVLTMPNGAISRGQFVELEPDRRVVFTWGWVDHPGVPPGSSTVEIEITAEDG
ncbi:MAG: SRPBCC domain-containing protein, partial [Halobacteriales archaeon]|nr:SRPBCC domain-containing protein [Halobacteriales archaeon]